ncbi:Cystin-1 [Galemys pyrenaicus]|uniref:Cystin-1 n=1 Tax=Galemys pyrenaicus TaxID=202257 RepID=A0A8J6DJZ5_GALPY|nr:Cystin-1 [Galemys pyrenaicus]
MPGQGGFQVTPSPAPASSCQAEAVSLGALWALGLIRHFGSGHSSYHFGGHPGWLAAPCSHLSTSSEETNASSSFENCNSDSHSGASCPGPVHLRALAPLPHPQAWGRDPPDPGPVSHPHPQAALPLSGLSTRPRPRPLRVGLGSGPRPRSGLLGSGRAMGSGSSRSGRALKRLRRSDSRPAGPGGAAREGGTGLPVSASAAAAAATPDEAREAASGPAPGPAAPPDSGDDTLRLLDQLLAESAAWIPGEPVPRGPARACPAASRVSPKQSVEAHAAGGSASEAPGSSQQRLERQLAISYDHAEEELMASIEREYCPAASSTALGGLPPPTGLGVHVPPPAPHSMQS